MILGQTQEIDVPSVKARPDLPLNPDLIPAFVLSGFFNMCRTPADTEGKTYNTRGFLLWHQTPKGSVKDDGFYFLKQPRTFWSG